MSGWVVEPILVLVNLVLWILLSFTPSSLRFTPLRSPPLCVSPPPPNLSLCSAPLPCSLISHSAPLRTPPLPCSLISHLDSTFSKPLKCGLDQHSTSKYLSKLFIFFFLRLATSMYISLSDGSASSDVFRDVDCMCDCMCDCTWLWEIIWSRDCGMGLHSEVNPLPNPLVWPLVEGRE